MPEDNTITYVLQKLRQIREEGELSISQSFARWRRTSDRVYFVEDTHHTLRHAIHSDYRHTLERMARFLIDGNWEKEDDYKRTLLGIASGLAYSIMDDYRKWLFELPSGARGEMETWMRKVDQFDKSFDLIATSIVMDMQRGFVGDTKYTHQKGNIVMNTNYTFSGSFNGANLIVNATLTNVVQTINALPKADQSTKDELTRQVVQLQAELERLTAQKPDRKEQIEDVAAATDDLIAKVKPDHPNRSLLNRAVEGVKAAAKSLEDVAPSVLGTITAIVDIVAKLHGLTAPVPPS